MSRHRSLKASNKKGGKKNVLSKRERLELMAKENGVNSVAGLWNNLPKVSSIR